MTVWTTWQHLPFSVLSALSYFWFLWDLCLSQHPCSCLTHGDSFGIVPCFGPTDRCLNSGVGCSWQQWLPYHPCETFCFLFPPKRMLWFSRDLLLQIIPIATMRENPFLGLWHTFNVLSIHFMLMPLFPFARVRSPKELKWDTEDHLLCSPKNIKGIIHRKDIFKSTATESPSPPLYAYNVILTTI